MSEHPVLERASAIREDPPLVRTSTPAEYPRFLRGSITGEHTDPLCRSSTTAEHSKGKLGDMHLSEAICGHVVDMLASRDGVRIHTAVDSVVDEHSGLDDSRVSMRGLALGGAISAGVNSRAATTCVPFDTSRAVISRTIAVGHIGLANTGGDGTSRWGEYSRPVSIRTAGGNAVVGIPVEATPSLEDFPKSLSLTPLFGTRLAIGKDGSSRTGMGK